MIKGPFEKQIVSHEIRNTHATVTVTGTENL